jgi:PhoPQ-activated pathogenicity-related protein
MPFGVIALAGGFCTCGTAPLAHAGLDEYVKNPDAAFAWVQTGNHNTPAGPIISLELTSQVWQGITWKHDLRIYEPRELHYVITNRPMPEITWDFAKRAGGESTLTLHARPAPLAARIWKAHSQTRDFRESRWESAPLVAGETIIYNAEPVRSGHVALLGEVEYQTSGITFHLTTSFFEPGLEKP